MDKDYADFLSGQKRITPSIIGTKKTSKTESIKTPKKPKKKK